MSKYSKTMFLIAIGLQVFLFIILDNCKQGEVYYINSVQMCLLALTSIGTVLYVLAGLIGYNYDSDYKRSRIK